MKIYITTEYYTKFEADQYIKLTNYDKINLSIYHPNRKITVHDLIFDKSQIIKVDCYLYYFYYFDYKRVKFYLTVQDHQYYVTAIMIQGYQLLTYLL